MLKKAIHGGFVPRHDANGSWRAQRGNLWMASCLAMTTATRPFQNGYLSEIVGQGRIQTPIVRFGLDVAGGPALVASHAFGQAQVERVVLVADEGLHTQRLQGISAYSPACGLSSWITPPT